MAAPLDIIVVEDYDLLRDELVSFLQRPGWQVRGADSGEQLDTLLRQRPAHIVTLDLNLPFEDGISIAKRLRTAMPGIGIVMLSARTRPSDRTVGYETGTDVYLTKPTNEHELESVIQNLARRLAPPAPVGLVLNMGDLTLCTPAGACVDLRLNEARLLRHLATAPERQMETDTLLRFMSHDHAVPFDRYNLAVMLSRLRHKIDPTLPEKDIVKAVRGYGYKLTVPIVVE